MALKTDIMMHQRRDRPPQALTLTDFDFKVPEDLIAQTPLAARDDSRLLVRSEDGTIMHHIVKDLPFLLPKGALIILNDSKVIASRLFGRLATGGKTELFLLSHQKDEAGHGFWKALGRPMKKLAPGTKVMCDPGLEVEVIERESRTDGSAQLLLKFPMPQDLLFPWLDQNGYVPLPPYIRRPTPLPASSSKDRDRYQTVYASTRGSVAAPTAGLHLTDPILDGIKKQGVQIERVCLHVGGGTFLPVKSSDVSHHSMHEECYQIPKKTVQAVQASRTEGRPVICVGTTSFRCLESLFLDAREKGRAPEDLAGSWRRTSLFIHPKHESDRYRPISTDGLMTNFHQPKSTLFMLVCSLIGWREAHHTYAEAMGQRYRLFSYGDTSLLWL